MTAAGKSYSDTGRARERQRRDADEGDLAVAEVLLESRAGGDAQGGDKEAQKEDARERHQLFGPIEGRNEGRRGEEQQIETEAHGGGKPEMASGSAKAASKFDEASAKMKELF